MANQVKNLNTLGGYQIQVFGRWVSLESRENITQWLRIKRKRQKKWEKELKRKGGNES